MLETTNQFESELPDFLVNSQLYSLAITDMAGYYVYVNEVFKQRFSFIASDFTGIHSFVTIHPEDHEVCLQAVQTCIAQPEKIVKVKLRKPDENKEDYYWTHWEFSVFFNSDKTPLGILCLGHDVSEKERAQDKLLKIVEKMDSLIEEISDSFIQVDRQWCIKRFNLVSASILQVAPDDLKGKKLWTVLPGLPNFDFKLQLSSKSSVRKSLTYNHFAEKLQKWFSVILYPSKEGYNIFLRDITLEFTQQRIIEDSEYKLKAIINSTNDSNLLINARGELINYNKAAKEGFFQYFHKDLEIGKPIKDLLPQEAARHFDLYFPKALQGEKCVFEVERVINGQSRWFEVAYSPVFDDHYDLIGVSKNTINITEKKLAELKIEEQERIFRFIYDSTTDACSFIDKNFRFKYLNKVGRKLSERLLGKKANIGDKAIDFVLPALQAEFVQFFESVIAGAEVNEERFDGSDWWQVVMKPVYDNNMEIIGISQNFRNITEKKKADLQIIRQNEILRGIAYQQSHELRRPVSAILGLCDLIIYETANPDDELAMLIESLRIMVKELDDSIRQSVKQVNEFETNEK